MADGISEFFGRNVSYAKDKLATYTRLRDDPLSPFKGRDMVDIFVNAAITGFTAKKRVELKKKTPNISVLAMSPEQKSILLTIAIAEKHTIDILFSKRDAVRIIEEYANGGIDILESRLSGNIHDDPVQLMAQSMKEIAKNWQRGNTTG